MVRTYIDSKNLTNKIYTVSAATSTTTDTKLTAATIGMLKEIQFSRPKMPWPCQSEVCCLIYKTQDRNVKRRTSATAIIMST